MIHELPDASFQNVSVRDSNVFDYLEWITYNAKLLHVYIITEKDQRLIPKEFITYII